MGEANGCLFEPTFNRSIKLRQADPRITSDAGALLLREVDHRMGLTTDMAAALTDGRNPAYTHYTPTELLRQHLYALALGYAHQDDQDALAHDVAAALPTRQSSQWLSGLAGLGRHSWTVRPWPSVTT